jgi:2-oxoglutarate ferredoxin oxidoreductase subunit alpha
MAMREALDSLEQKPSYLRLRSFPFHDEVESFIDDHEQILVIEQNQQGQMAQLLRMYFPQLSARIQTATYYGGLPLSAGFVKDSIEQPRRVEA